MKLKKCLIKRKLTKYLQVSQKKLTTNMFPAAHTISENRRQVNFNYRNYWNNHVGGIALYDIQWSNFKGWKAVGHLAAHCFYCSNVLHKGAHMWLLAESWRLNCGAMRMATMRQQNKQLNVSWMSASWEAEPFGTEEAVLATASNGMVMNLSAEQK